jgi:adenosylmethionine-8-amino-7-oxononanoate aminotransferase
MTTQQIQQLDKQYLWHPFTHMSVWIDQEPLVITEGEGVFLIDSEGNRYVDGISSLWCNIHGHRVKEIDQAIRAQLDRIAHTTQLGLTNDVAVILAQKLVEIAPEGLCRVLYASDGASATEMAFKLAVQYWWNKGFQNKHQLIAIREAYHGDTVGAMSVGMTSAFHKPYRPLLFPVHYAEPTLPSIESILRQHATSVAAICVEPVVMGASGMIVHPPGLLRGIRELADRYDVLLICDEIATGFGRTGRMWACDHDQVTPDLMCIGKGLTGGYLPLSATLTTQTVFEAFLGQPHEGKTFFHGHTYCGNPLACAAAIASIERLQENRLVEQVAYQAPVLGRMLERLRELPHVGEIRQQGYMVGVDLVADRKTGRRFDPKARMGAAVCQAIRRHGVILRPLGDTIVIFPPLVIQKDQLQQIVDAVYTEVSRLKKDDTVDQRSSDDLIAGDF